MKSAHIGIAALGAALLLMPALGWAESQSPQVQSAASRPQPSNNLPADFIDSRPVLAYFDGKAMPDTVRGLLEELKRPDR